MVDPYQIVRLAQPQQQQQQGMMTTYAPYYAAPAQSNMLSNENVISFAQGVSVVVDAPIDSSHNHHHSHNNHAHQQQHQGGGGGYSSSYGQNISYANPQQNHPSNHTNRYTHPGSNVRVNTAVQKCMHSQSTR